MHTNLPEILAPVADFEMCKAAVHNGADAIYAGMPYFNARGRAKDLSIEELKTIIDYCHLYGVKVFLAFNILIFQEELSAVKTQLLEICKLGPDALIVQDIGLVRLIKSLLPSQEVHASTQMTITSAEAIELTKELGISRYVLGREVSINEMQQIKEKTKAELEVFVHGALCVSYSGQCLTSERVGGRSANRGQCAQSCRLPYDLIVDGEKKSLGVERYLVSPKDLCALEDVERLVEIGVDSFKIEGRLKSPEYVASTVRSYKERTLKCKVSRDTKDLEPIYSRGFFNGWMNGVNHQMLVDARYSNHHGLEIGNVISIDKSSILITSNFKLSAGDGLVFCDFINQFQKGAQIYSLKNEGQDIIRVHLANDFEISAIYTGMVVFCNSSPRLEKEIRGTYSQKQNEKKIPLTAKISGEFGKPLILTMEDKEGNKCEVFSGLALEQASNFPLTEDFIRREISALGGTCFNLKTIEISLPGSSYIHQKELKLMRRAAVAGISAKRIAKTLPRINTEFNFESFLSEGLNKNPQTPNYPKLNLLIREKSQIEALNGLPATTVYLDFEFGKEYDGAVKRLRELGHKAAIATTRIHKPGENSHLKQILRIKPDAILVRNLGAMKYLENCGIELIADFSLNITNSLTASWFISKGITRYSPSYDLNHTQLLDLLKATGGNKAEVTIHQYMPAFHMEHCVFAAFLSNGKSYRDCGRPCEKHRVELRDEKGALHPLKADAECRNTMFHGIPQSSARLIGDLVECGVSNFRLEALYETCEELKFKIQHYTQAISGKISTEMLFSKLNIAEKYGVSEGQLLSINSYKDRKKPQKNAASI